MIAYGWVSYPQGFPLFPTSSHFFPLAVIYNMSLERACQVPIFSGKVALCDYRERLFCELC